MRLLHVAVVIHMAVGMACSGVRGLDAPSHPYVSIRTGQAPQRCADRPDLEHPVPHLHHAAFFFDLAGGRIEPGDSLLVVLNPGDARAAREYPRFVPLDGSTLAISFPAGLGHHLIRATWQDAMQGTKAVAESSLWVGLCTSER